MGLGEPMSPLKWYVECSVAVGGVGAELPSVLFYGDNAFYGNDGSQDTFRVVLFLSVKNLCTDCIGV